MSVICNKSGSVALPKTVLIREVGVREGLQTQEQLIATDKKLAFIESLSKTGLKELEITSFVRPDRVPQMADAAELFKLLEPVADVKYTALYLNQRGFELAEAAGVKDNQGWLYTAASESFLAKNNNCSHQDILGSVPDWLKLFDKYQKNLYGIMISTAFGCTYEGDVDVATVCERLESLLERADTEGAKVQELILADTMGWGTPEKVRRLVGRLKKDQPDLRIGLHLHDTRGMGIANVYAGLLEGVDLFESSIAGVGGCPFAKGAAGNICTEDLVYMLHELGIETGIDLTALVQTSKLVTELLCLNNNGKLVQSWKD